MTYYQQQPQQAIYTQGTNRSISNINGIQIETVSGSNINNGQQALYINGRRIDFNEPITSITIQNPRQVRQQQYQPPHQGYHPPQPNQQQYQQPPYYQPQQPNQQQYVHREENVHHNVNGVPTQPTYQQHYHPQHQHQQNIHNEVNNMTNQIQRQVDDFTRDMVQMGNDIMRNMSDMMNDMVRQPPY